METYEEFKESLKDGREIYYRGERVEDLTTHPILKYTPEFLGRIHHGYLLDDDLKEEFFFNHPESGTRLSKFYKIPKSSEDLLERFQMTYKFTMRSLINIAHIGSDMINALIVASANMGGKYAERMDQFAKYLITDNPVLAGAQMDVKGDRSLRPSEQKDPDMHVHVVDENKDGIIVCGAKTHSSWAYAANEILVIPSRAMRKGEEKFAVAFATPPSAKGIRMMCRPALEIEGGQAELENIKLRIGRHFSEALIIFDNVLIPWERVFVYKDSEKGSGLALLFALFHRYTAVCYRCCLAGITVGMAKLIAEYNGIARVGHIVKNIADLITYAEMQKLCAKMAAHECSFNKKTGIAIPNPLYTNLGKLWSNLGHMQAKMALIDTAGGNAITAPGIEDYLNPGLMKDIDKYFAGKNVSGIDRFKLFLLIRETIGNYGGLEDVGELHAEGSVWPSIMELYRGYNYDEVINAVKGYAGID